MTKVISMTEGSVKVRLLLWRAAISRAFVPLECDPGEATDFQGRIVAESLGALEVYVVSASEQRVMRSARLIERSESPLFKVSMPLQGSATVRQDGREAEVGAGDLVLYDTAQPYELVDRSGRMLVLLVPYARLGLSLASLRTVTAVSVEGREGVGALASPLLRSMADGIDELHRQPALLAESILDVVTAVYADVLAGDLEACPSPSGVKAAVSRFIDAHLSDPLLSPESIALGCHISTGHLHRLFRAEQSVATTILTRRLEHCRRALIDPGLASEAVATIGARWGFTDPAHFSRLFRAEYGLSPREYRMATRPPFGHLS